MLLQMEKILRANQWEPIRLDSGGAATKQIGPQYEYGAKLDPGTGTPEEIEYLHLFVTATPTAIGTFDWALQFKQQTLLFKGIVEAACGLGELPLLLDHMQLDCKSENFGIVVCFIQLH
jgi:hypothetical protein